MELARLRADLDIVISLVKKFGCAVEIDTTLIEDEVNKDNILTYMGMIEQKVTELMQSSSN